MHLEPFAILTRVRSLDSLFIVSLATRNLCSRAFHEAVFLQSALAATFIVVLCVVAFAIVALVIVALAFFSWRYKKRMRQLQGKWQTKLLLSRCHLL